MKAELQNKLLCKYPEFFTHMGDDRPIYTSDNIKDNVKKLLKQKKIVVPMQFGFEIGDGWYFIIDSLMGAIQSYIDNKNKYCQIQIKNDILRLLYTKLKYHRRKILRKFSNLLFKVSPKEKPHISIQVTQVKEKFGTLKFYFDGGDDMIDGMVRLAEQQSSMTCEYCGTTENVGHTQGWISTICKTCHSKIDNRKDLKWKPVGQSLYED
jgi:hypothetical protein